MEKENQETVSLKEYVDVKFANLKEIGDLKIAHVRELRDADQKALDLVAKNNALHFEQLNENAKRTIEERGHFISKEAYDPFERTVTKYMDESQAKSTWRSKDWGTIVSVATFLMAVVYFGLRLAGK